MSRDPGFAARASQKRRYAARPRQTTRALTAKVTAFAVVATLAIGGLLAAQMAAGSDPALGPKATAQTKKGSTKPSNGGLSSAANGSGSDPYSQSYGSGDYYYYGYGSGSGGSSSGSSGYSYSPPPVTSSTS